MRRYRLWCLWTDRSERLLDLNARSAESALAACARMGLVSGCGRMPRYVGIHVSEVS